MKTNKNTNFLTRLGATLLRMTLTGVCVLPGYLSADTTQPNQALFRGYTHGEYAAFWTQWVWSIPSDINPVNDLTGDLAYQGQEGEDVIFLAGTFGGNAERSISVSAGTAFFFPIWNLGWITFPEDELQAPEEIIPLVRLFFNFGAATGTFSLEIDGVVYDDMSEFLTESPIFSSNYLIADDPTVYQPCYTIGYYALVRPLGVGTHHLVIKADVPAFEFQLCVEYHIEVTP